MELKFVIPNMEKTFGNLEFAGEDKVVQRRINGRLTVLSRSYNLYSDVTRADDGAYVVEGPRIEKMLGYTNLDSEKGFDFFQKFLKNTGILEDLEKAGISEGDTVRMYGLEFDYYK